MRSSRKRSLALALLTLAAGAGTAAAWLSGLFAAGAIALAVGCWAIAESHLRQANRTGGMPPRQAPPMVPQAADRGALIGYLDASPVPLLLLDPDRGLVALNRNARNFFAAEDRIVAPPAGLVDAIRATDPGVNAQIALPLGSRLRPFALATSDVESPLGSGRIAALTDVEAELRAVEAANLRDLLQILGHEIANTLTPIASLGRTAADIIDDDAPDMASLRQAVETIARRAEGLQRFGEAYRELARLPDPNAGLFDTMVFLTDLERLFRTNWPAIALHCAFDHAPPQLRADRDQLSAALWAILQNAAEAADPAAPSVSLSCLHRAGETLFQVDDNGAGVPEAVAAHIFKPFVSHKADGTGIGLALARQIMRSHGGEAALDPSRTTGSRFQLSLKTA